MFRWCEKSSICLVYLADVRSDEKPYLLDSAFRRSRWHRRGWTLQELLAPKKHIFYGSNWERILVHQNGLSRLSDETVCRRSRKLLEEVTRIEDLTDWKSAGLATKLSWAATRKTTRKEDIAYCLLGVLNVQMPLLYGEGENAFRRLLLTIMEHDNNHDLLLARYGLGFKSMLRADGLAGILPRSPLAYAGCVGISRRRSVIHDRVRAAHYTITNAGLLINLPLLRFTGTDLVLAVLDYVQTKSGDYLTLPLELYDEPKTYRVAPGLGVIDMPQWMTVQAVVNEIYISTAANTGRDTSLMASRTWLNFGEAAKYGFMITSAFPTSNMSDYDAEADIFWFWPQEYQVLILARRGAANRVAVLVRHPMPFVPPDYNLSIDRMCWFHTTQCFSAIEFLSDHTWSEPVPTKWPPGTDIRDLILSDPSVTQPPKREIAWEEQIEITVAEGSGFDESEITLRMSYSQAPDRTICVMAIEPQQ